ncbi:hypothetical protein [Streptodolium elevatio]
MKLLQESGASVRSSISGEAPKSVCFDAVPVQPLVVALEVVFPQIDTGATATPPAEVA